MKRMMGLEPTTFCMASRRSSQLSYIRVGGEYSGVRTDRNQLGASRVTGRMELLVTVCIAAMIPGLLTYLRSDK